MTVSLRCVLQHWYELRKPGEKIGDENAKRYVSIQTAQAIARRQGVDGLRATILSSIRGTQAQSTVQLLLGAGLFAEELSVETYVRKSLRHTNADYRIAATYAALFYFHRSEEMTSILAERVVLAEEGPLIVLASRDALDIWSDIRAGGRCSRCGPTDTSPSTQKQPDWEPRRVLSK